MNPPEVMASEAVSSRKNMRIRAASEAAKLASRIGAYRWAEFGVRKGKSATALINLLPPGRGKMYLFDSWEGLPEPWHRRGYKTAVPKGHFACDVPAFDDPRVEIHKGWFDDTVFAWRVKNPYLVLSLVHLDCDLYSSTVTALEELRTMLVPGSVIIFDDLFGYPLWREGQWKAWREWVGDKDHTWIAHTPKGQAAVRLDESWA